MAKPRARRIPSDACPLRVGDETYYPHEGEWVELFPIVTVGDRLVFTNLQALGVRLQQAEGDEDEMLVQLAGVSESYGHIKGVLVKNIVAWNWTGLDSELLPLPKADPTVLDTLSDDEMQWLMGCVFGREEEIASDRKNGSRPLPTTSSATARRRTSPR